MPRFRYDKLVRDHIPRWHIEEGHAVNMSELGGAELRVALMRKLREEVEEVEDSLTSAHSHHATREELADVLQVVYDLARSCGMTIDDIERERQEKERKKGGFSTGLYIHDITMPRDDEWVRNCRAQPDKYPEIE